MQINKFDLIKILFLFSILLFPSVIYSKSLKLIEPNTYVGEYKLAEYGEIGPGQTFTIKIEPILKDEKGEFKGQWDKAVVINLPEGWKAKESKLYANPLVIEVTSPPNTPDGEYELEIKVIDEKDQEKIGGEFVFGLKVKVNHEIIDVKIEPNQRVVGIEQPAKFNIKIINQGNAKDVFKIKVSGVKEYETEKYVYIPAKEEREVQYEVVLKTISDYELKVNVQSISSEKIQKELPIKIKLTADLLTDYKAINNGILLFPSLEIFIYSIAGLVGALIS
jgi:hypothetical protein